MISDRTRKLAKAKSLGIAGFRSMNDAQLATAIAKATAAPAKGKTATVAKGKTATKVSASPAEGKTATTPKAKGKTATAPAAKSTARKTTPRASAAKGKATRQSGVTARTRTTAPGRKPAPRKPAVAKAPVKRTATRATATANGKQGATISKDKGTREFLDKKSIDWKAESNVGRTGKRKEVLDALRKYRGDYGKTFELLAPNWKRYYPGKTKADAQKLLRWLIARVAYDFAMDTNQHDPGSRRAYGTAGTNGSAVKTTATKRVAQARKTTPAPRKAATAKKPATRGKTAPAARKPAARRTAAPAAKRGGKVTAGRR